MRGASHPREMGRNLLFGISSSFNFIILLRPGHGATEPVTAGHWNVTGLAREPARVAVTHSGVTGFDGPAPLGLTCARPAGRLTGARGLGNGETSAGGPDLLVDSFGSSPSADKG